MEDRRERGEVERERERGCRPGRKGGERGNAGREGMKAERGRRRERECRPRGDEGREGEGEREGM